VGKLSGPEREVRQFLCEALEDLRPKRVQRKRTKGWRMPPGVVYVGRPTKWGNPYVVGHLHPDASKAVGLYLSDLMGGRLRVSVEDVRRELKGKTLACWCALDMPCHADVLLEIANEA
jgi:hypothetical protein